MRITMKEATHFWECRRNEHDMKNGVEMACETKQAMHAVISSALTSVYLCAALLAGQVTTAL